jgi:hypothetical protein
MGGFLVIKLVKPTKTVCSWTPHQSGIDHLLFSKTKAYVWATAARVLGKADATVREKVRRLDTADCALYQVAKLLALFVGDGGAQVLNLDQTLADKYYLGNLRNTRYPRVANQLRIQR